MTRVVIGKRDSVLRISLIGWFKSMRTTSPPNFVASISGMYLAGSVSSCSRNTPFAEMRPRAWRSAEHDTPMPIGRLAPWRGRRMTRTSWQKYLPPNCAPMPLACVSLWTFSSISRSRKAWPYLLPCAGRLSR